MCWEIVESRLDLFEFSHNEAHVHSQENVRLACNQEAWWLACATQALTNPSYYTLKNSTHECKLWHELYRICQLSNNLWNKVPSLLLLWLVLEAYQMSMGAQVIKSCSQRIASNGLCQMTPVDHLVCHPLHDIMLRKDTALGRYFNSWLAMKKFSSNQQNTSRSGGI